MKKRVYVQELWHSSMPNSRATVATLREKLPRAEATPMPVFRMPVCTALNTRGKVATYLNN